MPEKIVIAELDINMQAVIEDSKILAERIVKLREETKKLKESEGETSAAYIRSSAELKVATSELRGHERLTQAVIIANRSNAGSLDQLKAELSIVSRQWSTLSKEERLNSEVGKELTQKKLLLTEQLKAEESATGDNRRNVGNYSEAIKEAAGSITSMIPGFNTASKAAKVFGVGLNWALLPITAIVIAVISLISYFKRTEDGSNKLSKIIAILSTVFQNVMDVVGKVGEAIFSAFENPKQAITGLWELIKTNLLNRLTGIVDSFKAVGRVLKGVFTLDWDEVKKGASEFGESMIQVATGVDDLFNKAKKAISGFIDEAEKEAAQAAKIADQKAALRKRERSEILNDAKDEYKIAELRAKAAEKDKYNGEERLKLIEKAIAIENSMMQDDLDIARQKASIHAQEIAMSDSTAEDLDEQAKLEANIFEIQKANAEARRGFEKQRQSAINDMNADLKAQAEESVALMEYELEVFLLANKEKISNSEVLSQKLIDDEEKRLNEASVKQQEILAVQKANGLITEQEYNLSLLQLEDDKNVAIAELNKEFSDQQKANKLEALKIDYENQQALFDENILSQLDAQKIANDQKLTEELKTAEKVGANKALIEAKYRKADIVLEKAKTSAKIGLAQGFASNVATIAGENTKVGKAAAVAAATMNTYQAATGAYAALAPIPLVGPALGIAAAAAAVISGISNVKKILSTQPGSTPSGDSGAIASSSSSGSGLTSSLQSVNTELGQGIVSRATETGIYTDQNKPIVAVPVDEVTRKQLSETAKIETATI